MSIAALVTWCLAALLGLYLVAVWLIEYDRDYQRSAATHLPIPVVSAHALLAVAGLCLWTMNFLLRETKLAWVAVGILTLVAFLGLVMAFRWIKVYRAMPARERASVPGRRDWEDPVDPIPPERNFPLSVVLAHGAFAVTTLILVLLTALAV